MGLGSGPVERDALFNRAISSIKAGGRLAMIPLFIPEGPGAFRLTFCNRDLTSAREVGVLEGEEEASVSKSIVRSGVRVGAVVAYQSVMHCVLGESLRM